MLASVGVSISRDPDADPEDRCCARRTWRCIEPSARAGDRLELFDEELRREPTRRGEAQPSGSIRSHAPWHSIARLKHLRR